MDSNQLKPMAGPRGFATPSHILYVDDIMVFCKGIRKNLNKLMLLFEANGEISGQQLSIGKCKFFAGSLSLRRLNGISDTAFPLTSFLLINLVCPFLKVSLK